MSPRTPNRREFLQAGEDLITLCAPGALTHEVPVGD